MDPQQSMQCHMLGARRQIMMDGMMPVVMAGRMMKWRHFLEKVKIGLDPQQITAAVVAQFLCHQHNPWIHYMMHGLRRRNHAVTR